MSVIKHTVGVMTRYVAGTLRTDGGMFNQIARITDHLYLSSAAALREERLRALGITHILNCTTELPNGHLRNIEYMQVHVDDTPSTLIGGHFERVSDKIHTIHQRGGKALVHCMAGVSRSASFCLAYLMKYLRMTLDEAHLHVKSVRPVIRPNPGFWRQLIEYERRLFGKNSVRMITSGVGTVPDVYKDEVKNMYWFAGPTVKYGIR